MSSSIRWGLKALLESAPGSEGAILMLADQTTLTGTVLKKLTHALDQNDTSIIAARSSGQIGAPALFPRAYFDELLKLDRDKGAKSLLHRYSDYVVPVELLEAATDFDTPEEVAGWQRSGRNYTTATSMISLRSKIPPPRPGRLNQKNGYFPTTSF